MRLALEDNVTEQKQFSNSRLHQPKENKKLKENI